MIFLLALVRDSIWECHLSVAKLKEGELGEGNNQFSSVQSLSHVRLFETPWTSARHTSLSISNSWSLFKLISIQSVIPSNYLILCCPLHLPPSIFPSIKGFSNELALCIRWPKYWSFSSNSVSVLPMNIQDWFPLGLTDLISLLSKGLLRVFSNTTVQKHQFFSAQLSLWSNSHKAVFKREL